MFFDDKAFIGRKIQYYRKQKGLTQAELAEKIDLSEKHISKIESGIYRPSISVFFKVVDVLGINLNEFGLNLNLDVKSPAREELLKYIFEMKNDEIEYLLEFVKLTFKNYKIGNR